MARKRTRVVGHPVVGPVKLLDESIFTVGGLSARVSVMRLEPRCPAPKQRRGERRGGHPKHVSIEIESAAARLQIATSRQPKITASDSCLSIGALKLDFAENWKSVTVAGRRYDLAKTGPRVSHEFAEDGRLAGLVA